MRILAIESSGRLGSVAVLEGRVDGAKIVAQAALTAHEGTAKQLAPTLKNLFDGAGWPIDSLGLVVVTAGPGSFTGLRIGVTTAKTLAFAVGAELLGVNTLDVLAAQVVDSAGPLWAILDAQRQELFAAQYDGPADRRVTLIEPHIVPAADWLANLRPSDIVTGPALARVESQLPEGIHKVDPACRQPMAGIVGQLGWRDYQAGRRDDLWQLVPNYYRLSAAEEKLAARSKPRNY